MLLVAVSSGCARVSVVFGRMELRHGHDGVVLVVGVEFVCRVV